MKSLTHMKIKYVFGALTLFWKIKKLLCKFKTKNKKKQKKHILLFVFL